MWVSFSVSPSQGPLAAPPQQSARTAWPLEELTLKDGRVHRGLVESESTQRLVFVEVGQPAGKPMFLWVQPIRRELIASRKRLPPAERAELRRRLEPLLKFKSRAHIEAGRMASLKIVARISGERTRYLYQGDWFELESTSDEETTRRSVVRLEQVFMAYRRILAPRIKPRRPLRILLLGSTAQYRQHIKQAGLDITNPAYFSVSENLVVAGSDITRFGRQLAKVRANNRAVLKEYQKTTAEMPARLERLSRELKQQGFDRKQRRDELVATRRRWQDELEQVRRQIASSERRNAALFDQFAKGMLTRLRHEALHAYVENYVYGHANRSHHLARWLNEGLAQVFEGGQIDADTLRIDAPNRQKLVALQADLRSARPLPLAELLRADQDLFLVSHPDAARASDRHYLYCWGLVYYLTFATPGFNGKALDALTSRDLPDESRKLERWVAMPLTEFEKQWHAWMLKLAVYPQR